MANRKGAESCDAYIQFLIAERWILVMNAQGGGSAATAITTELNNRGHQ